MFSGRRHMATGWHFRGENRLTAEPYTLLYLLGSGRNGSTVLDLVLAGHPDILALGEISTINRAYDPFKPPSDDHITLRFAESYRRFWVQVKEAYESATRRRFEEIDIRHPRLRTALLMGRTAAEPWVRANLDVLGAVRTASGRAVLSDASGVPQRLLLLQRSGRVRIKVVHLVRDGRAVSCSYLRRYGTFAGGMRTWTQVEVCSLLLRRLFPPEDWMDLRYEELAARPAEVVQGVCAFLGLSYDETMLDFHAHRYFGIGGNPTVKATRSAVIRLDDRWRDELGTGKRITFGMRAGWLNRLNGYPAFASERRVRRRASHR